MFDAEGYFRDRRIDSEPDGAGWVNIQCPVCRSAVTGSVPSKKYLGYNIAGGYFNCWRCGRHQPEDIVMALEGCEYHEACRIVIGYQAGYEARPPARRPRARPDAPAALEWPPGTVRMMPWHRDYLGGRGYDPEYLEWKYGLLGTLDCGPYANRVLAPIILGGRAVSYQGRDITGRSPAKYKTCRREDEVVFHKHLLYNLDNCRGAALVVVEGVADVWRLGDHSAATFGTMVLPEQVRMILEGRYRRVATVFDAEPDAQRRARFLRDQLAAFGVEAVNARLKVGDPGDLGHEEAREMMRRLLDAD